MTNTFRSASLTGGALSVLAVCFALDSDGARAQNAPQETPQALPAVNVEAARVRAPRQRVVARAPAAPTPETNPATRPQRGDGPVSGYVAGQSFTGTKTDTPIIETPQSISVVTRDFVQTIGATQTKDALTYTPGVNVAPFGADARYDWLFIRGFDAYSPGFYLDGMLMRNAASFGVWATEPYGTERIEVLRGPSSVLYGQNAAGGMVNVVSKRPTEEPFREIQAQLGSYSHRQIATDLSGPLSSDGKWLYRLTGLVRDAELQVGGLPNDRVFIAPSLTWRPNEDTSLTLLSHYLNMRTADTGSGTGGLPLLGTLLPNPNGRIPFDRYIGDRNFDHFNQKQWMIGYLFEHRVNDILTLRQNARVGGLDLDFREIGGASTFAPVNNNPTDPANYRLMDRYYFGSDEKLKTFTIDNQAQVKLQFGHWQHTVLFGLDYQRTTAEQAGFFGGTVPPINLFTGQSQPGSYIFPSSPYISQNSTLGQTGFYVQDQIKFGNSWVATLGGRYDLASTDITDRLSASRILHTDGKFSGRAGLVYLAPGGFAPYVSYSESFTPSATVDPITGDLFKPETGKQVEAGIRYQPPGRKDLYSIAAFEVRRQNYITRELELPFQPRQTGEVTVQGLELEAKVRVLEALNVIAAYTWTPKADVTASSRPDEVGKQLNAVPQHQFSLWSDYRFDSGIKLGGGVRFVGETHGQNESVVSGIPSFTLFDAMVSYELNANWKLSVNARNLTDKRYATSGFQSGNSPLGADGAAYFGDSRRIIGTATYRW